MKSIENHPIKCSKCGQILGEIIELKGQDWLMLGGSVVVRNAFGVCGKCGQEFHWSVADRMLSELMKMVLEARESRQIS